MNQLLLNSLLLFIHYIHTYTHNECRNIYEPFNQVPTLYHSAHLIPSMIMTVPLRAAHHILFMRARSAFF